MTHITLNQDEFQINAVDIMLPIAITQLEEILGPAHLTIKKYNHVYTWSSLGICAFSKNGQIVESLNVYFTLEIYDYAPNHPFDGQFLINNTEAHSYFAQHKDERIKLFDGDRGGAFIMNGISAWFDLEQGKIQGISIEKYHAVEQPHIEPLPIDEQYTHLIALWNQWQEALRSMMQENNDYYNLTQGITAQQLEEVTRRLALPAALTNFYKIHNVKWHPVTSAFCFSINGWQYDLLPFQNIVKERELLNMEIEPEPSDIFSNKLKIDGYCNSKWIPFAEGRNGDYLLIDTDPSPTGTYGQIIELQNESWQRLVVANSLEDLIQAEIELIYREGKEKYRFIIEKGAFGGYGE